MIKKIVKRINSELESFFDDKDAAGSLARISPYSLKYIREFSLRDGKRIRPLLFILSYLGFAKKKARNYYRSAVALELIHAFILMHDDIVDRSDLRRGLPSLHKIVGSEKAMLIGDILYALGIKEFMSVGETPERKEKALNVLLDAAILTGCGEVNELLLAGKGMDRVTIGDIYSIYDLKTSYYTFVVPLVTGAVLAGASEINVERLKKCGLSLGRAYQLKDDMLGLTANEAMTGKSAMTDLAEKKMTVPLLYTYRHSDAHEKKKIRRILNKRNITRRDLDSVRKLVTAARTEDFAKTETCRLIKNAKKELLACGIKEKYREPLLELTNILA
jgi:geranylgeranyl diphosphate synthase, type I